MSIAHRPRRKRNKIRKDAVAHNEMPNTEDISKSIPAEPATQDQSVVVAAVASSILMWLSFPPVGWWWLGWVATMPLIWLVARPQLAGAWPYRKLYAVGIGYWLATFYFIPYPHWALWIAWIVLALYLGLYFPAFIAVSRMLVFGYRIPLLVAAPAVWVAMEWIRSNFITGMGMACLSHSQFEYPLLIQVSDLFGAYTLTFAMAFFATGLVCVAFRHPEQRPHALWLGCVASVLAVAGVVAYGAYRLPAFETNSQDRPAVIALIQGSIDTEFPKTVEDQQRYLEKRDRQYFELSTNARQAWDDLDLMVWPESSFPYPEFIPGSDAEQDYLKNAEQCRLGTREVWGIINGNVEPPTALLAGTTAYGDNQAVYNAAILIRDGQVRERYLKNHRVMVGEYIPFSNWFPWVHELSPIGRGLTAGSQPVSFCEADVCLSPNICFESTVPHLIRRHVNQLVASGQEPDALLNLTNDGWFFGSSCLDFHLACNVFRAVEMRKSNLVCANTGFSGHIDPAGRILVRGPRRKTQILRAEVRPAKHETVYRTIGDWPLGFLSLTWIALAFIGRWLPFTSTKVGDH